MNVETMRGFQPGDLVTGLPGNQYGITTESGTMKVLSTDGDYMSVRVIAHKFMENEVGSEFRVEQRRFRLLSRAIETTAAPTPVDRTAFTRMAKCSLGQRSTGEFYADLLGPKGLNAGCGHTIDDRSSLAEAIYAAVNFCDAKGILITDFKKEK